MALYLILAVDGATQLEPRDSPRKVFDIRGGRIGRAPDCDWVLSNSYISRHHATVAYADGVFYIERFGANGIAVNDPRAWVRRHTLHALSHGDRLFLADLEIGVRIEERFLGAADSSAASPVAGTVGTGTGFDVTAFLEGAGLAADEVRGGKALLLGKMVRTVVQGLCAAQQAQVEFGARLCSPQAAPPAATGSTDQTGLLAVTGAAEDALATLMCRPEADLMLGLKALEDALDGWRFHHLALSAGLHAGFQGVARSLDPHALMQQCRREAGAGGWVRFVTRRRCWDRYTRLFAEAVACADGAVRLQHAQAFTAGYRRQLEDLQRSRVRGTRAHALAPKPREERSTGDAS